MSVIDKLYAGYGETSGGGMRAGHQGKLFEEGNAYLDREFPRLDRIIRATVIKWAGRERLRPCQRPQARSAQRTRGIGERQP